ncbi:MAG: ferrochelatase, partial [Planctomycetaceae bacterium]|nr:ferrochelatase [Planctomycetaceae bacterium]
KGQGVTDVAVLPIGFLSDHMEVLYDLDYEAAHLAEELGIGFQRGGTPSGHPEFAPCLADLIEEYLGRREPSAVGADPPRCMTCPEGCCPGPQRPGR